MVAISDAFARANGALGSTDTGQPWQVLAGTVTVGAQRAVTGGSRALAVVDCGVSGQNGRASAAVGGGGGYALYFRVTDANNWWRAVQTRYSYTYQSGTETYISGYTQVQTGTQQVIVGYTQVQTGTQQVQTGTDYTTHVILYLQNPTTGARVLDGNGVPYRHFRQATSTSGYPSATGNVFPDEPTDVPGDFGHLYRVEPTSATYSSAAHYETQPVYTSTPIYETQPVYTSTPIYSTRPVYTTGYAYQLRLEKSTAGTLALVGNADLPAAGTTLAVSYQDARITATLGAATVSATDSFGASATLAGLGYAESTELGNTDGLDNFTVTVFNTPPGSPQLLFPTGGQAVDRTGLTRLRWQFADPDLPNDAQSAAGVRYRPVGSSTWTAVAVTGPSAFTDLPGGTLPLGDYEWQVRSTDSAGLVGPWSGSEFFSAIAPPPGPTILAPTGGSTAGTPAGLITWSTAQQDAWQVRQVADAAGTADPGTVYVDSGTVLEPATRTAALAFPVNGRVEHAQVRVRYQGLWSPWTDVRITVAYTPPPVPGLLLQPTADAVVVTLSVRAPVSTEPAVASIDLYRRRAGRPEAVRIGKNLAAGVLRDYSVGSGIEYEYQAKAYAGNGTSSVSTWTLQSAAVPTPSGTAGAYGVGVYGEGSYS